MLGREGGWPGDTGGEEEREERKGPGTGPTAGVKEGWAWAPRPSVEEEPLWKLCGLLATEAGTTDRRQRGGKNARHG